MEAIIESTQKGILVTKIKDPYFNRCEDFVREFISQCLNMDAWQHTWHMTVEPTKECRKKVIEILDEKILGRKEELRKLEFCKSIARRYDCKNIYEKAKALQGEKGE